MFDDELFENLLDYPEVLVKGHQQKRRFWDSFGPYSSGYVGPASPRPIPSGRVELPLRIDPDLVPPPEFDVLESRHRERSEKELTEDIEKALSDMEAIAPQFFLRNIGRMELDEYDEPLEILPLQKGVIHEEALQWVREKMGQSTCFRGLEGLSTETFYAVHDEWRLLRGGISWGALFNREAKERVEVPMWAFFPDRFAYEMFRGTGRREFIESEAPEGDEPSS